MALAPFAAAVAASPRASASDVPRCADVRRAAAAGAMASTIVRSPSLHRPRSRNPSTAAAAAAARPLVFSPGVSPRALPARRSAVPQSGPAEPPTPANASAAVRKAAPGVAGGDAARADTTARQPSTIVTPWSPSPAIASRRSSSLCATSVSRNTCSRATVTAAASAFTMARRVAAWQERDRERRRGRAARRRRT